MEGGQTNKGPRQNIRDGRTDGPRVLLAAAIAKDPFGSGVGWFGKKAFFRLKNEKKETEKLQFVFDVTSVITEIEKNPFGHKGSKTSDEDRRKERKRTSNFHFVSSTFINGS